jgi:hypothetical protein
MCGFESDLSYGGPNICSWCDSGQNRYKFEYKLLKDKYEKLLSETGNNTKFTQNTYTDPDKELE